MPGECLVATASERGNRYGLSQVTPPFLQEPVEAPRDRVVVVAPLALEGQDLEQSGLYVGGRPEAAAGVGRNSGSGAVRQAFWHDSIARHEYERRPARVHGRSRA